MRESLLDLLICPFCGDTLDILGDSNRADGSIAYGMLSCACGRYPIVAGIPIIKKDLPERLVDQLRCLDWEAALGTMLRVDQRQSALVLMGLALSRMRGVSVFGRLLRQASEEREAGLLRQQIRSAGSAGDISGALRALLPDPRFREYLLYKFTQPRHLVALSCAQLLHDPDQPVLDLGCGIGHITRALQLRAHPQPVVGLDQSFSLLYCAARFMDTDAQFICSNADFGLPLRTGAFSHIYCFDAFHYVRAKKRCVAEMKRIATSSAVYCLGSVRNSLVPHLFRDEFIPPHLLGQLMADLPHRMVADESIVTRYLRKQGPPLAESTPLAELERAELVTLVATRQPELLRDHAEFDGWPHARGRLGVNPLYRKDGTEGERIRLRRVFPSRFYAEENAACKAYLPESVTLSKEAYQGLCERGTVTDPDERTRLVDSFIAVGMPNCYGVGECRNRN